MAVILSGAARRVAQSKDLHRYRGAMLASSGLLFLWRPFDSLVELARSG